MIFLDDEHKKYYEKFLNLDCTSLDDTERKSLFYLLSFNEVTRHNINSIYDFKRHWIKTECLNNGFQTSGSLAITKLAFNLYNGFNGTYYNNNEEECKCSIDPLDIFSHFRGDDLDIILYAIKIRFGEV